MNKSQYLSSLKAELIKLGLKKVEIERAEQYYSELIDEAVDSGKSIEDAIHDLPLPKNAAKELAQNIDCEPIFEEPKVAEKVERTEKVEPRVAEKRKNSGAKIVVLIVLGIVLFPFLITVISVGFSLFIAGFSVMISLVASGVALPIYGVIVAIKAGSAMVAFAYIGGGLLILGIGLLTTKLLKPLLKLCVNCFKSLGKFFKSFAKI